MKKLVLILSIIFAFQRSFSQLQKGNVLLRGDLGFSSQSGKSEYLKNPAEHSSGSSYKLQVSPGFFVTDRILAGVVLGYGYSENKRKTFSGYNNVTEDKGMMYSGGIVFRSYRPLADSKLALFLQVDLLYESSEGYGKSFNDGVQVSSFRSENTTLSTSIKPGIVYFINDKIGIEVGFGALRYFSQHSATFSEGEKRYNRTSNGVDLNLSLPSLTFGLNFYFGKNSESAMQK